MVALFVSLGGTTYAVTALPRNSVGPAQLRARAVTEAKLAEKAVITSRLANGAVTAPKIARGTITGAQVAGDGLGGGQIHEDSLGPVPLASDAERAKLAQRAALADRTEHADRAGRADSAGSADRARIADRAGAADQADRAGVAGALERVDYNARDVAIPEGGEQVVEVACDAGLVPVGGGFLQTGDPSDRTAIADSAPGFAPPAWVVLVVDAGPGTGRPIPGRAYAVCVEADTT